MDNGSGTSPLRIGMAVAALLGIVAVAVLVAVPGDLRCPAAVEAAQTFSLEPIALGSFMWSLRDGRPPGGQALVRERALQFERSDLVEMVLEPGLVSGGEVASGQTVAVLRSLRSEQLLDQLRAERASIEARRALVVAGGPPEAVAAAERAVAVAEAELASGQAELERLRQLETRGLVSRADVEVVELGNQVRSLQVEAARAGVDVARSPAQPEAVAELDALIAAVDAGIAEMATLLGQERVACPIAGVAEVVAGSSGLKVTALDPVYLEVPIPAARRQQVRPGSAALFTTAALPGVVFDGEVVEVAATTSTLQGQAVCWASVALPNPDRRLASGMLGTAVVAIRGDRFGPATRLRRRLGGRWL